MTISRPCNQKKIDSDYRQVKWTQFETPSLFSYQKKLHIEMLHILKNAVLFICISLVITPCFAQGGETYDGRVNFLTDPETGQTFNPFDVYGDELHYYIRPDARTMTINFEGADHVVDIARLMHDAFETWRQVLNLRLIFEEANSPQGANLVISLSPVVSFPPALAASVPAYPSEAPHPATLQFYTQTIQNTLRTPGTLQTIRDEMEAGLNNDDILHTMLMQTALHEIGHVLGYAHPNHAVAPDTSPSRRLVEIMRPGNSSNPSIPLLMPSFIDYIRNLHQNLGRRVEPEDIGISAQEVEAMDRIWLDVSSHCPLCPGCAVSFNSNITNIKNERGSNNQCYEFQWAFPAAAASDAINHFLLEARTLRLFGKLPIF